MKVKKSIMSLILCLSMIIGILPLPISADVVKVAPTVTITTESGMTGNKFNIVFGEDYAYSQAITFVKVGDIQPYRMEYGNTSTAQYYTIQGNKFVGYSKNGLASMAGKDICIVANGYEDLHFKIKKISDEEFEIEQETTSEEPSEPSEPSEQPMLPEQPVPQESSVSSMLLQELSSPTLKPAPNFTSRYIGKGGFDQYQVIDFVGDSNYVSSISSLNVNGLALEKKTKIALFGSNKAYAVEENNVFFDGSGEGILKEEDVILIQAVGYEDLKLIVTKNGSREFEVKKYDETGNEEPPADQKKLHVRLVGAFEHAMVGQQKYDAISGATGSITSNKNSNVEVQAALMDKDAEPTEKNWVNAAHLPGVRFDTQKSKIKISPEESGMKPVYSTISGAVTLQGVPKKAGQYKIFAEVVDTKGRTVKTNELIFEVFGEDETLADRLQLKYAEKFPNNNYYKYDMKPWRITKFGGENETVTMPKEIGAWFGSHTSGTYGYLGSAIERDDNALPIPTQTLIIPSGASVTLVNVQPLSSVKIVVKDGAKLSLDDTSVHGIIEVERGGTFSMNYDAHNQMFKTGASINGQLILHDGAKLENAMIYSNSNYLANGNKARKNTNPVVLMKGKVTVAGKVFIKGDEAATGRPGQPALEIDGGDANLADGAVLAVFGGGNKALTTVGGAGVVLKNNGKVSGNGTLIAMGGSGFYGNEEIGNGGNGVDGTGEIATDKAWLEGGAMIKPYKNDETRKGRAKSDAVTVSLNTNAVLQDGVAVLGTIGGPAEHYWSDITKPPVLDHFVFADRFNVTIEPSEGGVVTATPVRVLSGETVKVSVQANKGYMLNKLILRVAGTETELNINQGGISFVMLNTNAVLKPQFTKVIYRVDCKEEHLQCVNKTASGEAKTIISAYMGDTINVIAADRVGYKLKRLYYTVDEHETDIVGKTFKMPADNVSVFAQYEPISYQIDYQLDDGVKEDQKTYTIENLPLKITPPTKKGYQFIGWSSITDNKLNRELEIAVGTTGDLTFKANWKKIVHSNSDNKPEKSKKADKERKNDHSGSVKPQADVKVFAEKQVQPSHSDMNFDDVKRTDWFYQAVEFVFGRNLMEGVSEKRFSPYTNTTRGMLVTILYRMEKMPASEGVHFSDVKGTEYYAKAVNWAAKENIVVGYADGTFRANNVLTREQLVSIIMRYMQYKGYDTSATTSVAQFSDSSKISDYAVDAVCWAYAQSIINGTDSGKFEPKSGATRAQLAALFMNLHTNMIEK